MNKNLQKSTTNSGARRRLVRGAFAAPVALTLYNGSAFAATSLSCVAKEISKPAYPVAVATPSTDTYLRVRLWTLPKSSTNAAISNWIKGEDVSAIASKVANTPFPYIQSGSWQCYIADSQTKIKINGSIVNPVEGTVYPGQPSVDNVVPVQDGAYVALRVDSNGKIVGVVGQGVGTSGNSAVHGSCWASFKPTA